jgi:hypothetical protein
MARTPETWVDPDGVGGAYAELINVEPSDDGGRRIQIPATGRRCVSWLREAAAQPALVEIGDRGRIRLRSWKPFGEAVVARRRELVDFDDPATMQELLTLTERFRRVHFERSGRFPLHEREQFHLGLSDRAGWFVLLVCLPNEVQLWSEEFRRHWRERISYIPPWRE